MGTRRSLRKSLLVLLASLVVGVIVVEVGFRAYLSIQDRPWSSESSERSLEQLRDNLVRIDWRAVEGDPAEDEQLAPDTIILHPYIGFDVLAAQSGYSDVARQMRAFPPGSALHIVISGGSVSGLLVRHAGARIAEGLRSDPRWADRKIFVHPLNQGGKKQPQQLMALSYVLAMGWRPDIVVNVDGFNEVALASQNMDFNAHPLHPSASHWIHLLKGGSASLEAIELREEMLAIRDRVSGRVDSLLGAGVMRSALAGTAGLVLVRRDTNRYRVLQGRYVDMLNEREDPSLQGPPFQRDRQVVIRQSVIGWMESSISMAEICRVRGIRYLHVLQPTLHDEGAKPHTAEEIATGTASEAWLAGVRIGYPMLRQAAVKLREHGVGFLDASRLFQDVTETLYYDACHFVAAGSEMLADAIVAELRGLPN